MNTCSYLTKIFNVATKPGNVPQQSIKVTVESGYDYCYISKMYCLKWWLMLCNHFFSLWNISILFSHPVYDVSKKCSPLRTIFELHDVLLKIWTLKQKIRTLCENLFIFQIDTTFTFKAMLTDFSRRSKYMKKN